MGLQLFRTKRFLPLFITQFMGAFNDNFFKNALLILITYKLVAYASSASVLVNIAQGIFMLPFFLFSATAGQLADKYDRASITRIIKVIEIILMCLAALGMFAMASPSAPAFLKGPELLLAILFFMGAHSTFFGPIKYALLPQHLKETELIAGNAYIEAATYVAILGGTIFGGVLVAQENGELIVGAGLIAVGIIGYMSSRWIPASKPAGGDTLKVNYNFIYETIIILKNIKEQKVIYRAVLGISWFWAIGALMISQLPTLCKSVIGANESVFTFYLAIFTVGIGVGSVLCNKILRGIVQTTFVPLGALGMSVFMADLYFAYRGITPHLIPVSLGIFMQEFVCWRLAFDMFMFAGFGGIFIVPLYALVQHVTKPEEMARVIAGNNVANSLFIVAASLLAALALSFKLIEVYEIFIFMTILNALVGVYTCLLLPGALVRSLLRSLLAILFRVEVRNLENYNKAGERVLIIANHTSLLDGLLIASFMPEKVTFAINTHIAKKWWAKAGLAVFNAFPMDPTNPLAARSLIEEIKKDRKCMIFPEGRITVTGALMKVYEGSGMIAEKSGAMILPVRINGAQYSKFSYLKGKVKTRFFPKITMTVLEPRQFKVDPAIKGRERRQKISAGIYDQMVSMIYQTSEINEHLFHSLLSAANIYGHDRQLVEDQTRTVLNYSQLIRKSYILGNVLRNRCPDEKYIGLMIPNSLPNVVAFWGLQGYDRVPCMINFTAGATPIIAACQTVGIKTIFTSRKFITMAKLDILEAALKNAGIKVKCLEDVKSSISIFEVLWGLLGYLLQLKPKAKPEEAAAVIFTSGSEGAPKAVVLSHRNLQANRNQVLTVMPLNAQDRIMNCLPMFHSFGLSMGTVMPLLSGIRTFFYPSPLHYRYISELSYDSMATIIFSTDTFLAGYGRVANPYDFFNVRFAFVGAEKLRESTAKLWMDKFGVRIFEGYGTSEASPVVSANTPMYNRPGTVGRLMPCLSYRIEPVPGIEKGGELFIKGDNIMMGYMRHDKPGILQPPTDGWYDTGDIVEVDNENFITIKGRAKRFAKIAGEMVSLTAVEAAINTLWPPKNLNGIVTIDDARKGEQLVLVTNNMKADSATLLKYFREHGLSELWVPKRIIAIKDVPLLGTGKIDYVTAKKLALEKFQTEG